MIEIDTGESNISDHKLTRMKKSDIIALFRETEKKLFGADVGHKMFVNETNTEIEELNDRIDDHMIQEAMNVKTIQELNESNKKLMEKIKFYQDQKENGKKRENKISDYFEKGMLEKVEGLESLNKELEGEVVRLEELCKVRFNENEKLKKEMDNLKETFELGSQCAEDVHNSFYEKIKLLEKEKEELIDVCKNKNEMNEALEEEIDKLKATIDENYKHHYAQFEPVLLENEKLKEENKRLKSKMFGFMDLFTRANYEFDLILEKYPNPNVIDPVINEWITDCCQECCAHTELDNLYCDFKGWCEKESHDAPKRNIFKENLKIWQANSRFGIDIGEKKSDAGINGYEAKPRFNLKVI
jgi:hypothetical protein